MAAAATLIPATAPAQTVILVRHAEKATTPPGDPPLTAAGQARAGLLAEALRDAHLTRVMTSTLRRTCDTAAPAAAQAHLVPEAVPIAGPTATHVAAVVARIRASPKRAVVLVVGHSDTIPLIAAALGAAKPIAIPDCAFDRMFVLSLGAAPPPVVAARYGAPSTCPPPAPNP